MQRQLMINEGPDKGRSFDLVEGETLIVGRGSASDTQINDPQVSRMHCHIYVDSKTQLCSTKEVRREPPSTDNRFQNTSCNQAM